MELTDRLLRLAGDNATVLNWVEAYPGSKVDLTFNRAGKPAPTKRAEALHFVYGGKAVDKCEPLLEAMAAAIVTTRTDLQKYKHADGDLHQDRAEVAQLMKALHGSLSIGLRLAMVGLNLSESASAEIERAS